MKVNHGAIIGTLKFLIFGAFISSIIWRLYVIVKFGGTRDKSSVQSNNIELEECVTAPAEQYASSPKSENY